MENNYMCSLCQYEKGHAPACPNEILCEKCKRWAVEKAGLCFWCKEGLQKKVEEFKEILEENLTSEDVWTGEEKVKWFQAALLEAIHTACDSVHMKYHHHHGNTTH